MAKKTISISQIGTFTTCAYKWHVTYERGIRVKRGEISPSALGSVVHIGLAAALREWWVMQDEDWSEREDAAYRVLEIVSDVAIDAWDAENRPEDKQAIRIIGETDVIFADDEAFYERWQGMIDNAKELVSRTLRHADLVNSYRVLDYIEDGKTKPFIEFWLEQDIPGTEFVFTGILDVVAMNLKTGMVEVIDWKVVDDRHRGQWHVRDRIR